MNDRPTDSDVQQSSGADKYSPNQVQGGKTSAPSNYESNFGGQPKSMSSFAVKKTPGRL